MINLSSMSSRCLEWIDILCLPLEERAAFTFISVMQNEDVYSSINYITGRYTLHITPMYIFNFDNIKYKTQESQPPSTKRFLCLHIIFKTLITLMIDLVLYCVCVRGGGG